MSKADAAAKWLKQHGSRKSKRQRRRERKERKRLRDTISRNYYLYGLELEGGNYYVGMTAYKDAIRRYEQHVAGTGAVWTRIHKPVRLMEVRNIGVMSRYNACLLEDKMTLEYFNKYGMAKVRGGKLCMTKLSTLKLHYNEFAPVTVTTVANSTTDKTSR